jgi:hypothetical protein
MTKPYLAPADIDALMQARRRKPSKDFKQLLDLYRKRGFSDAEIVQAMADSRVVINPLRLPC